MVLCFAPGCTHRNERDKCKMFTFPKSPNTRRNWKRLIRFILKPKLGDWDSCCPDPYLPMEDEDIHICGACKKQFSDILLFMRHKNEENCSSSRIKRGVSVSLQTSDLIDTASALASISESVLASSLSGNKHVGLSYDVRKDLSSDDNSSSIPLVPTGHEFMTSTCGAPHQTGPHTQDQHVEDHSTGSPIQQNGGDQLIGQQGEPVLESRNHPGELRGCYRRHFLDVEEDVATLLANHFTSDGPLQPYPTNSESLLTYGTMSEQLVLTDSRSDLDFEADVTVPERRRDEMCPDQRLDTLDADFEKSQQKRQLPALVPVLKKNDIPGILKPPEKTFPVKSNCTRSGDKKGYLCVVEGCSFRTTSSRDLGRHMRVHTGEKPFKCLQCGRTFSRHDKLTTHLRIHNGMKKLKCPVCPYSCVDRNSLAKHMRTHTDERPYKCQMCDYSARVSSHLIVHLRTHTGDHPFICGDESCGKMFKTSSDLKRHQRTHSGEKPFACTYCPYRANIKSNLRVHIRVSHSSDKVFSCSQCKVVCSSRQSLNEHERTHTDVLHCNKCDFSSLTPSGLKSHNKIHSPDKLTRCRICSFTTKHRSNWKVHMKRKHPEVALKKSKSGRAETEEMKVLKMITGTFRCKECTMTFVREDSLRSHVRQHQRKNMQSVPEDTSNFNLIQNKPHMVSPVLTYSPTDISRTLDTQSDLQIHNVGDTHSSVLLYRGIQLPQMDEGVRETDVLEAQSHPSSSLVVDSGPQYVMIQTDSSALNEALSVMPGGMQYVLCESLGPLSEPGNPSHLLC